MAGTVTPAFVDWVRRFEHTDSAEGELARDISADMMFDQTVTDRDAILAHLWRRGADEEMLEVARTLLDEYERLCRLGRTHPTVTAHR